MLKETQTCGLKCITIEEESLRIVTFANASFSNNADGNTQLGYRIHLAHKFVKANVVKFESYKDKRIVRSVISAETIAFEYVFDNSITLRHDLQKFYEKKFDLKC